MPTSPKAYDCSWHITKFCCTAKPGRKRGKADIAGSAVGSTRSVNDPQPKSQPQRDHRACSPAVQVCLPRASRPNDSDFGSL
jgi:hypothetical protein